MHGAEVDYSLLVVFRYFGKSCNPIFLQTTFNLSTSIYQLKFFQKRAHLKEQMLLASVPDNYFSNQYHTAQIETGILQSVSMVQKFLVIFLGTGVGGEGCTVA